VFSACVAASRGGTGVGAATLNQPFDLRPGTAARLDGDRLEIGFEAVVSDSRCPRGAQCITAGEAIVSISLSKPPAAKEHRQLSTTPNSPDATCCGYRVRLVALEPAPALDRTIAASDYVATLLVSKE
jgi:hypothetical protein